MRKNILPTLFLFAATNSFTQDTLNTKQGNIYRKGLTWRMDGKKLSPKEFKDEIYKIPEAISYYKKYNTSFYLSVLALASGSACLWFGREKDLYTGGYSRKIKPGYLITAVLFEGTGLYLLFRSNKYLKHKLWSYETRTGQQFIKLTLWWS